VIDNVVRTDSWLSITSAGCGLTRVGAGDGQARKVVAGEAGGVEKTSWLGSRARWPAGSSTGRMVARTAR
jgi:hypothetical protein